MDANLFLRGIHNPALGARGQAILSRPEWEGTTLEDLYQIIRDQYNELIRIDRLDLAPNILRDYANRLDLSTSDIARALSMTYEEARALIEFAPVEERVTALRLLWAQTQGTLQSGILFDPIGSSATALAQNLRDMNATASELASANNISVSVVNDLLSKAQIENFVSAAQVAEIQTVPTLSAEQTAQWYANQVAQGLNDAQIRLNVEAVIGAQTDSDWQALQALAVDLGYVRALPVSTFASESEIAAQVRAVLTMSATDKAEFYNRLLAQGYTDAGIRLEVEVALGEQSDSDWQALQALA
ncbi:MAG: hypothetical protein EBU84_21985, partial [Actinobacteria bacterium]|nr:hypothetical protein [Actinomycetota bacterium]